MDNKAKYLAVLGAFIILSMIGYAMIPKEAMVFIEEPETISKIYVHLEGCVEQTGVMEVLEGTRLYELIEMAGGETEDADLTKLNLVSIVADGQKIVIPKKQENVENEEEIEGLGGKININTAGMERLDQITGIGPVTAKKIIEYREKEGYFSKIEDIMNVDGIGESKFHKIKEEITI